MLNQTGQAYTYAGGNPVNAVDPSGDTKQPSSSGTPVLRCGSGVKKTMVVSDYDGTMTLNFACWIHKVFWSYIFSLALQAIAQRPVIEFGMLWQRNWGRYHQQAPHPVARGYGPRDQWHGTFNPVYDFDEIDYIDQFAFDVRGAPARGQLIIFGAFLAVP